MKKLLLVLFGSVFVLLSVYVLSLFYLAYFQPVGTAVQLQRYLAARSADRPYVRRYRFVPLEQSSEHLSRAVVAAEDTRFFQHAGIDWVELQSIVETSFERGRLGRGGSTITQQLVKNLYLTTHRSALRKVVEMPMALIAELILSKERILELYLNVIEWGPGIYGMEAAARYHYGKTAAAITRDEAARLAASIPAPLDRKPQAMDRYSKLIRARMRVMGW